MIRLLLIIPLLVMLSFFAVSKTHAQENLFLTPPPLEPTASAAAEKKVKKPEKSVTEPEAAPEKRAVLTLLNKRTHGDITITNFLPYTELYAIKAGVPANTIILILLLPLLATIVVTFRYLIGLSGLGLLVPIALS